MTASGRTCPRIRAAVPTAPTALAAARAALSGLLRLSPSTAIARRSYPASGTIVRSARSPPTKTTRAPSARSASATASAGTTCPAVPPAAMTIVGAMAAGSFHDAQMGTAPGGDVEQQPHAGQQHGQVRRSVGDEGQRHAGQRRQPQDGEDVQARLAEDERRD